MRACLGLLLHSVRRLRALLFVAAVLLAAFQILLAAAARSLQELNTFSGLTALVPDFLRQVFGSSLLTLMSFRGIACLSFFHVAVLAFLVGVVIAIATEPAGEIETRFLDLVLSHPLARFWVITRTVLALFLCIAFLLGAMLLGSAVGLYGLVGTDAARETFAVIPRLALNLGLLLLCWGAIALAMASLARRRSEAGATGALLAMTCYMTDMIAQVWKPLTSLALLSPFHYYNSLNLITGAGGLTHDVFILSSISVVGFSLAYLFFQFRDL